MPYTSNDNGDNNGNGDNKDKGRGDRPPLSGDLTEIHTNLEGLMKSLGVVTSAAAREEAAKHGAGGGLLGLDGGLHENIMQITNKLQTDMMEFTAFFGAPPVDAGTQVRMTHLSTPHAHPYTPLLSVAVFPSWVRAVAAAVASAKRTRRQDARGRAPRGI